MLLLLFRPHAYGPALPTPPDPDRIVFVGEAYAAAALVGETYIGDGD
jgi:hypothetical protein